MPLLTSLGLSAATATTTIPNYGPAALIFHFLFAYGILSSRTLKQMYGLDNNVSPREDLAKHGDAAVREGKISQKTLDMLKRNESAHANSVENYTLLVAGVSLATFAGVDRVVVNRAVAMYTIARIAYAIVYITIDRPRLSQLRGICWWTGNLSCLTLLWKAGKLLSA
ncbi:hypothetical protein Plec18167_003020 [Paecilomyces lecythidis]|uniref:Glutathione transferase n=1 Tax=Paecilomyces lecythidis TaxID=3004212 RepID=A0ABR3Y3J7_9EURO